MKTSTIRLLSMFAGSLLLFSACSTETEIDPDVVEESIETGVDEQVGLAVEAECPSGVVAKQGETFSCLITADVDGSTARVVVEIQNDDGDVIWEIQ